MSQKLTRNRNFPGGSNTSRGGGSIEGEWGFYEVTYTVTSGAQQETIYLPQDVYPVGWSIHVTAGSVTMVGTNSPPDVIGDATPAAAGTFVTLTSVGTITGDATGIIQNFTAFALVAANSTTVKLSVTC